MTNTKNAFELNGAIYAITNKGYYWKTVGTDMRRISRAEYEQAWDELIGSVSEADEEMEWEQEVTAPKKEAAEKAAKSDEAAEKAASKKGAKKATKKATKKVATPRKSKDVAYENKELGVTLTAKQVDFIHHLPDTCFWENGLDSMVWTDALADEIGGQFADKPMTVGAMISTICEKGLGYRTKDHVNGKKCTAFGLTEKGKTVAKELGLE